MKMKKIITAVLVASLSMTSIVPAFAATTKQQPAKTTQTAVKFEKPQAVQKVKDLIAVYNSLAFIDKVSGEEALIIAAYENLDGNLYPEGITTSDGKDLGDGYGLAALIGYYDLRLNKKQSNIKLMDFTKQSSSESLKKYLPDNFMDLEANKFFLDGAITISPYLSGVSKIEYGPLVADNNTPKIKGFPAAYSMTLTCDGIKNELKVYFDKNGNMVTIAPVKQDWGKYYQTFTVTTDDEE